MCYDESKNWNTMEEIAELEEAEKMVMTDEAIIEAYITGKLSRAQRRVVNISMKKKERIKTRNFQRTADSYKRNCKKKGYDLKYKGQTRKDCAIVPADALGWDKINMNIMGTKLHGIKVGYIFDVT